MKKNLLFLFAASALFAACSSDELPNGNTPGDGEQTTEEVYASSVGVTTEEGLGMRVGALNDTKAVTRIGEGEVYFTLEIPDDVLSQWESYVLEADDFAIRINGEYVKVTPISDSNGAGYMSNKIQITGDDLTIQVEGLQIDLQPALQTQPEITFETYLWIENQIQDPTENGITYVERFTYADKLAWIGLNSSDEVNADTERGYDVTQMVADDNGAVLHSTITENQNEPEYGYSVRYNVYRGLQGNPIDADGNVDAVDGLGNTPYIKVSIHVNQLDSDVPTEVIPVYPTED
ncbi:hypothetical protein [Mediterranea sp. An20]|uniref:hypothetical protein n=1 Tax=Mediterranea sp. An20 TaxID=1965586 RepID=UPI00111D7EE0|nr:hypothetical protein [Mediterranea sp. An20]